ncbi:hypothetical protein STRATTON_177 [Erwinia phage vB_EamM_Stratton]|uniref:Uncharacterized protein n=1 Tax=Erwinia phage vB_EamM_Stratton TaxID=1883378 RepID=A0A1B2IH86_9CAUD|nr:hypothetical protein STRATTON_177 [Erwinia phage vB_EamM_Stratton]
MAKSLQELFVDMINEVNPDLGLTLSDVTFGAPSEYTPADSGDTRNTVLTLVAKDDSPNFKGSKDYHFFRFNFTNPGGVTTPTLTTGDLIGNWQDDAKVLMVMNMMLPNYKLTAEEIAIERVTVDDTTLDVRITIDPNHLKWHGTFVTRVIDEGKTNLQWLNPELSGFK